MREGAHDPALAALYFQYGRYLLIGSSRPGDLPANLQGIWNEHIEAPWNADYHVNINLQMNYWPAEVTNLSERHEPFFDFVERLVPAGRRAARDVYGAPGFVAHHTTDAWHWVAPIGRARVGPVAARRRLVHPALHGALPLHRRPGVPRGPRLADPEGGRGVLPGLADRGPGDRAARGRPEQLARRTSTWDPDGEHYAVSMGAAMDQQIVWDVFTNTLEAAEALGSRTTRSSAGCGPLAAASPRRRSARTAA